MTRWCNDNRHFSRPAARDFSFSYNTSGSVYQPFKLNSLSFHINAPALALVTVEDVLIAHVAFSVVNLGSIGSRQFASPDGSDCHPIGKTGNATSDDDASHYDTQGQKKAPPVTDRALLETATRTRKGDSWIAGVELVLDSWRFINPQKAN